MRRAALLAVVAHGAHVRVPTVQEPFVFYHIDKAGGSTMRALVAEAAKRARAPAVIPCHDGVTCLCGANFMAARRRRRRTDFPISRRADSPRRRRRGGAAAGTRIHPRRRVAAAGTRIIRGGGAAAPGRVRSQVRPLACPAPEQFEKAAVVAGHFSPKGLEGRRPAASLVERRCVTVLREPLARHASYYKYYDLAKKFGGRRFAELRADEARRAVGLSGGPDFMSKFLGDGDDDAAARDVLRRCATGTTERYNATVAFLAIAEPWLGHVRRLQGVHENPSGRPRAASSDVHPAGAALRKAMARDAALRVRRAGTRLRRIAATAATRRFETTPRLRAGSPADARGRKRRWDVWAWLSTPPRPRRGESVGTTPPRLRAGSSADARGRKRR